MRTRATMIKGFYCRIASLDVDYIEQVPVDALVWINRLSDKELAVPFIIEDLIRGDSRELCASKFESDEITEHYVRSIGERVGRFKTSKLYLH